MEKELLDILACPKCKLKLMHDSIHHYLVCQSCKVKYPFKQTVPLLSLSEAIDKRSGLQVIGTISGKQPIVKFRVIQGQDQGLCFEVERGTCRIISRVSYATDRTMVSDVDTAIDLDTSTRQLVDRYVINHLSGGENGLRSFRRLSDIGLTDKKLSKTHAMLFFDTVGIAILDLVSKNGTFINGTEVESAILSVKDTIQMGVTSIVYEE